jgi:cytochrome d ubiquinol oxidase subunit II
MNSVDEKTIIGRARKQLLVNTVPFLVFFLTYVIALLLSKGFAVDPSNGNVSMEDLKYLNNLLAMPVVLILFLAGVILVLLGIILPLWKFEKNSSKGIWFAGFGTVLTVFSLFLLAGLNNTSYYPSTYDLQSSLTIMNSSSSHYTLTAMSYVSYAWRSINKKKIDTAEMEGDEHAY